jgi:hypothetical protein
MEQRKQGDEDHMKNHTMLIMAGLVCAGTLALLLRPGQAFAQTPTPISAFEPLPEMSQFCGQNALQVELFRAWKSDTSDRRIVVRKLAISDRRLFDRAGNNVVSDFRIPAAGTIVANGNPLPMTLDAHGDLQGILPSAGVNWFSSNAFQVLVYDAQGNQIWEFGLST